MNHQELTTRRAELGQHLEPYLSSLGIVPDRNGMIKCLNPAHRDDKPSMRLMAPHREGLICYSCGTHYDIFDVATVLEGKPDRGPGFITDNVNYLSDKLGLAPLTFTLTPEDEKEILCERVHRAAGTVFMTTLEPTFYEQRGWKDPTLLKSLGVGTITDRDAFIQAVAIAARATHNELHEAGLDFRMFGPRMLTFRLDDSQGRCVGFAARDMDFEKKPAGASQKYLNPGHERNILYRKNQFIYNLHRARDRKLVQMAILTEGYADVIAGELFGVRGVVAHGGTALSHEQIKAMVDAGIRDVLMADDYDFSPGKKRAGQDAMLHNIELFRAFPQVRLRIIDWEKVKRELGPKYPDLHKFDLDWLFTTAPRDFVLSLLSSGLPTVHFKINELKARGLDDRDVAEAVIPDIASIPDPLLVQDQVHALAMATQFDEHLLLEKVKQERQLRDYKNRAQVDELLKQAERTYNRQEDVGSRIDVLKDLANKASACDPRQGGTIDTVLRQLEATQNECDGPKSVLVATTGIQDLDNDLGGGLPLNGYLLLNAGRSHIGKTQLLQRLLVNILTLNPGVECAVWTLDDDARTWYHRIWSAVSGLPIYKCMRPRDYITSQSERDAYNAARKKVAGWVADGRLFIQDASGGNHVAVLEKMVSERTKRSSRPMIVFFDNFHKTAGSSDRSKLEETAERVKHIVQHQHVTVFANAEVRKVSGDDAHSKRPITEDDIKETGKLHYDPDYILLMDSPMVRLPYLPNQLDPKTGKPSKSYKDLPDAAWQKAGSNVDLPIVHLERCKNKVWNIDGIPRKSFLLKFDPSVIEFTHHNPGPPAWSPMDVKPERARL